MSTALSTNTRYELLGPETRLIVLRGFTVKVPIYGVFDDDSYDTKIMSIRWI